MTEYKESIEYKDANTREPGLTKLAGFLVTTGAAGAVNSSLTFFKGGTITRTTTGTYQIQLDRKYRKLIYAAFRVGSDGTVSTIGFAGLNALPGSQAVSSTGIVTFVTNDITLAVADANRAVSVAIELWLQKHTP